jgi:hypothetical protein|nr:MAG TPA: hypothetical protein [Caudoviricetes sp.]DAO58236.1 MAG TPA: hypothetical protein [Caudoviricetes sp.]DAY02259.1 MAG TPA: hypothetical protein [Caudoviricetes sp.]
MEIREDKTVSSDYKEYITGQKELFNGYATAYTFPNGYGASVIYHDISYGIELAVLDSEDKLTYDTPITDNVIGYIETKEDLNGLLRQIKEL